MPPLHLILVDLLGGEAFFTAPAGLAHDDVPIRRDLAVVHPEDLGSHEDTEEEGHAREFQERTPIDLAKLASCPPKETLNRTKVERFSRSFSAKPL